MVIGARATKYFVAFLEDRPQKQRDLPSVSKPLGNHLMLPRVGLVFLSGEQAASIFREAGKFFLWENRIIGEANVA